jgi:membrane dipeptidase
VVEGLEDVSKYPSLTAELLRRGYRDEEIKKILGLNILRVMRAVEKVSATEQKQRPASPTLFTK